LTIFKRMRRRDWAIALVVGSVIAAYAVMDDLGDRGDASAPAPGLASPDPVPGVEGTAGTPPATTAGGSAQGVTRLRAHTVVDRTGFEQPIEAVSVLVPDGWRFESRVTWTGEGGFCSADHAGVFWDAMSPDGDMAVGSRPAILVSTWPDTFQDRGVQANGYCHLGTIESHRQFAEQVLVPILRPGNRVVEVEEITEIPAELRQLAASRSAEDAVIGGRTVAAGTAVVSRTPDGRYDDAIVVFYLITDHPAPGPFVPPLRLVLTNTPLIVRAPAGDPDRVVSLAATILGTVRYNPAWQRAIQQVDANISRIQAQGAAERSRILANSFREVGEIQMSGWQSRMDADWRGTRSVTDALAGLDRRIDPHTGQEVRLDAGGTRYFANSAGEYLVVEAPDVDPRRLFPSEDWREMGSAARPR
jgi:hypothetical protein